MEWNLASDTAAEQLRNVPMVWPGCWAPLMLGADGNSHWLPRLCPGYRATPVLERGSAASAERFRNLGTENDREAAQGPTECSALVIDICLSAPYRYSGLSWGRNAVDTVSAFRSQTDKDLEDYVQKKYKVE